MLQEREIVGRKEFLPHKHTTVLRVGVVLLLALFPAVLSAQVTSNSFCKPFEKMLRAEFPDLAFGRNDDYGDECQMTISLANSRRIIVEIVKFSSKKQAKKEIGQSFDIFSIRSEMRSVGYYGSYSKHGFWSDAKLLAGTDDYVILLRIDTYVLTLISVDLKLLSRTETALRNQALYK